MRCDPRSEQQRAGEEAKAQAACGGGGGAGSLAVVAPQLAVTAETPHRWRSRAHGRAASAAARRRPPPRDAPARPPARARRWSRRGSCGPACAGTAARRRPRLRASRCATQCRPPCRRRRRACSECALPSALAAKPSALQLLQALRCTFSRLLTHLRLQALPAVADRARGVASDDACHLIYGKCGNYGTITTSTGQQQLVAKP